MEILRLHINIKEVNEVISAEGTVKMLLFDGQCEGDFFNGSILNGGVDTQRFGKDGTGTLSARYMLSGYDNRQNPCHLFIENNAKLGTGDNHTEPIIYTDSEALSWLEREELTGRIEAADGKLDIVIEDKK